MERLTSRKNPKVLHLKKLGSSREYRREQGEYICDGRKLLNEAIMHGADISCVLSADGAVPGLPEDVPFYVTDMSVIEAISPLKNPQPVLFSCRIRKNERNIRGNVLILENVQDPGNVGTMLRTANAMGIGTVLLTGACADPYNPKTVRASMGAVYRQNFFEATMEDIIALRDGGMKVYGAALDEKSIPVTETDISDCAVVIGSEGQGLTREMLDICTGSIIIPMAPECESLNAGIAAAIIMWEMSGRCRH